MKRVVLDGVVLRGTFVAPSSTVPFSSASSLVREHCVRWMRNCAAYKCEELCSVMESSARQVCDVVRRPPVCVFLSGVVLQGIVLGYRVMCCSA